MPQQQELTYDSCKYGCYLKQMPKGNFRVYCRKVDPKCKVSPHLPALVRKEPVLPTYVPPPPKPQLILYDGKKAQKLRDLADKMESQIEVKLHPPIAQQRTTARRAGIAARLWEQGEHLQLIQAKLYAMADAIEQGTLPPILFGVKSKADVDKLLIEIKREKQWNQPIHLPKKPNWAWYVEEYKERAKPRYEEALEDWEVDMRPFIAMGLTSDAKLKEAVAALETLGKPTALTPEQQRAKVIKEMEQELIGRKIPGYFPTPTKIAEQMVSMADIQPDVDVLEPGAGKGNIADVIRAYAPDANLEVIEWDASLRKILEAKGYQVVGTDFLAHNKLYDRIIMNPPFEKFQDIDQVLHAYRLLRPGGRIVSIMGEATFFRDDKKAAAFREWLDEVGGDNQKLPAGAFYSSERPTGVNARIVVIDKQSLSGLRGYFKRKYPYSFRRRR